MQKVEVVQNDGSSKLYMPFSLPFSFLCNVPEEILILKIFRILGLSSKKFNTVFKFSFSILFQIIIQAVMLYS